jgi:hypothetical protein
MCCDVSDWPLRMFRGGIDYASITGVAANKISQSKAVVGDARVARLCSSHSRADPIKYCASVCLLAELVE